MTREVLPDRRYTETVDIEFRGARFSVGFGYYDDMRPAEIFITGAKEGSQLATAARDAAVVASVALQHGAPAAVLRHGLSRHDDGSSQTLIGYVLDKLEMLAAIPNGEGGE